MFKTQIPSSDVLMAFNLNGELEHLNGGEGTSYLIDSVVLKPISNEEESIWRANLMSRITQDGFRVPKPIQTKEGNWTKDGWQAFTYIEGKEVENRWEEKIAVSRKFHTALKEFSRPSFIDIVTHPWAISDRMIWGDIPLEFGPELVFVMKRLQKISRSVHLPSQLIHGDMTGNILFHPTLPPAIIDMSPYWRPAEYATAIIIVDSVVWDGAPDNLLDEMENTSEMNELLIRAAMWRIKTKEEYMKQYGKGRVEEVAAYDHLIGLLEKRVTT